jgi:hypothetical protein
MALLKDFASMPGKGIMSRSHAAPFMLSALLFLGGPGLAGLAAPPPEYQVKAVFLFNFTQFVEWPAGAFSGAQAPLVIGILGEDPFGAYLDETVRGETVNNRPILVKRYRRVEEIQDCQLLFISRSEAERLEQIFAALKDRSILTVGDIDGFARRGGMIRFVVEKNKIRFRVNLDAAKAGSLMISSKLLRSAKIVDPGKD